jgi:hypothetical protein
MIDSKIARFGTTDATCAWLKTVKSVDARKCSVNRKESHTAKRKSHPSTWVAKSGMMVATPVVLTMANLVPVLKLNVLVPPENLIAKSKLFKKFQMLQKFMITQTAKSGLMAATTVRF